MIMLKMHLTSDHIYSCYLTIQFAIQLTPSLLQAKYVGSALSGHVNDLPDPLEERVPLDQDGLRGPDHDLVLDGADADDAGGPRLLGVGFEGVARQLKVPSARRNRGGAGQLQ